MVIKKPMEYIAATMSLRVMAWEVSSNSLPSRLDSIILGICFSSRPLTSRAIKIVKMIIIDMDMMVEIMYHMFSARALPI